MLKSIRYALTGILSFARNERNGRIQIVAAITAAAWGVFLHISTSEWIIILLCSGAVLSLEMINTAIEKLCDLIEPSYHPQIKTIKDISAGAVLLSAVVSLLIGIIIFAPKIISLF